MKPLKASFVAGLALIAAGTSVLAWKQYVELAALRVAAATRGDGADKVARLEALERRNRELEARVAASSPPRADETAAVGAAETRTPVARSGRGGRDGGRGGPGGDSGAMRALMGSPEVQALRAIQQRGELDDRYASLFRNLKLQPAQLEKFKTLLSDRQSTMMDVMAAAREQGVDPRAQPEEFRRLVSAAQADLDQSMKQVLGDAGYAQYQAFEQTAPQRNVVTQLERRLSYTDAPLTPAQSDQLVKILASTAVASAPSGAAAPVTNGSRDEPSGFGGVGGRGPAGNSAGAAITTAAVTQAHAVLSAPQIAALQQLQTQQQAQQQLQQTMRNGANPPTGTQGATTGRSRGGE